MKSQPLAYNKDNQEDKEPLFDTTKTVLDCLEAYSRMLPGMRVKSQNTLKAALKGYATATDLADYLVRKNLPFRDAHDVVGKVVDFAIRHSKNLDELTLAELQGFSTVIEEDVFTILTLEGSIAARNHIGGTAPEQVLIAIERIKNGG